MALILLISISALMLVGGIILISTISDNWQDIRQVMGKNSDAKKEKIRLKHEYEMEKLRLEHERDEAYAGALGRSMSESEYRELGLLGDDDQQVQNKD